MFQEKFKRQIKIDQRRILQGVGLEKEFRRLQRKVKKEMNGAKIYLYRDIRPESLGEYTYTIEIHNDEDYIGQVTRFSVKDVLKALEEFIDE